MYLIQQIGNRPIATQLVAEQPLARLEFAAVAAVPQLFSPVKQHFTPPECLFWPSEFSAYHYWFCSQISRILMSISLSFHHYCLSSSRRISDQLEQNSSFNTIMFRQMTGDVEAQIVGYGTQQFGDILNGV